MTTAKNIKPKQPKNPGVQRPRPATRPRAKTPAVKTTVEAVKVDTVAVPEEPKVEHKESRRTAERIVNVLFMAISLAFLANISVKVDSLSKVVIVAPASK